MGILLSTSVIAADDYMQALDAEAHGLAVDPASGKEIKSPDQNLSSNSQASAGTDGNGPVSYQGLPGSLTYNEFEEVLNQNFKGSYLLYKNLAEKGRIAVYKAYQEQADIDVVRESISAAIKSQ